MGRRKNSDILQDGSSKPGDNTRFLRFALETYNLPPVDTTDDKMVEERILWYFNHCAENDMRPGLVALANALGVDRITLKNWADGKYRAASHTQMIRKAYDFIEESMEAYMLNGKINPASAIFLMKNNHGYRDQTEMTLTPGMQNQDTPADQLKAAYLGAVVDSAETPKAITTEASTVGAIATEASTADGETLGGEQKMIAMESVQKKAVIEGVAEPAVEQKAVEAVEAEVVEAVEAEVVEAEQKVAAMDGVVETGEAEQKEPSEEGEQKAPAVEGEQKEPAMASAETQKTGCRSSIADILEEQYAQIQGVTYLKTGDVLSDLPGRGVVVLERKPPVPKNPPKPPRTLPPEEKARREAASRDPEKARGAKVRLRNEYYADVRRARKEARHERELAAKRKQNARRDARKKARIEALRAVNARAVKADAEEKK